MRAVPHQTTTYNGPADDCYGCHQADYTGTTNPNHATVGFPTTCDTCHTTTAWTGATSITRTRRLPADRRARHRRLRSMPHQQQLHTLPTACYCCHQADFTGTTNPAARSCRLPDRLHAVPLHHELDYVDLQSRHRSFPLTGFHATLTCAQCHTNNNYTTLPTTCYGCHQADFTGTTNPSHVAAGFPTTCDTCHTTTDWTSRDLQSRTYANYAADRVPCHGDLRAVPHQQQLRATCRRHATRATRPTSPAPRIPRTLPRASRPIAPSATRPPTGRPRPSITPRRRSR